MTALEKFAAILEEIQKDAAGMIPRGGRRMHPGWLGAGKPMSPTSPTRFMGAERGAIPPTKVEAMTSGVSREGVKSLLKGRLEAAKPLPVQPAMPGKVVRPGPFPREVRPPPEPKVWMDPVSSAGLHEAWGHSMGRLAQKSRGVTTAPSYAVRELPPASLQRVAPLTSQGKAVLEQKAGPVMSLEAITKKRVARAAAEQPPSHEVVRKTLAAKWAKPPKELRPSTLPGELKARAAAREAVATREQAEQLRALKGVGPERAHAARVRGELARPRKEVSVFQSPEARKSYSAEYAQKFRGLARKVSPEMA